MVRLVLLAKSIKRKKKMKTKILLPIVLAVLSFTTFAKENRPLPQVQPPRELVDVGSEYAEGTITRLTAQDVAIFVPFAQNAQNILNKAMKDIDTMPIEQQVRHLSTVIKSVVKRSGEKSYQMLMRFALNRGLFLVSELTREADVNDVGVLENALDLQVRSIRLALSVYESDLSYQRRAATGSTSTSIGYAAFAMSFAQNMLPGIMNVFDATAQYRLFYKSLEMINWDFSRDEAAFDYSDAIIEIYDTLEMLEEDAGSDDFETILNIRKLHALRDVVAKLSGTSASTQAPSLPTGPLKITALVEGTLYELSGSSSAEIYTNCVSRMMNQADEMTYVANGGRFVRYYNSYNYLNGPQICAILEEAVRTTNSSGRDLRYDFAGSIETTPFHWIGTKHEILKTCSGISINQAYDIAVSINGGALSSQHNSSSFWTGKSSICGAILRGI